MINVGTLKQYCSMDIEEFKDMGDTRRPTPGVPDSFYTHIDRGAPVLGVAHLDSPNNYTHFHYSGPPGKPITHVWSPTLDNRMGAYILLQVLTMMDINCDVLLTTDHFEKYSTARDFVHPKEYRWTFSFDLASHGVSMYNYETVGLAEEMRACRLHTIRDDSYADIVELWPLGIAGFNFWDGVFWRGTQGAMALLRLTRAMVLRFAKFYSRNRTSLYTYEPTRADVLEYRDMLMHNPDDGPSEPNDDAWSYCDFCTNMYHVDELADVSGYNATLCGDCAEALKGGYLL